MRRAALPVVMILAAAVAGCSSAWGPHAAALVSATRSAAPDLAGSSPAPGSGTPGQPGSGPVGAASAGTPDGSKSAKAKAGTPAKKTAAASTAAASTAAATGASAPDSPSLTADPDSPAPVSPAATEPSIPVVTTSLHGGPTVGPSPTVTLTPAAQATCTATGGEAHVQATVTQDEAGSAAESFYTDELDAAGLQLVQYVIVIPGPLTAGEAVSGEAAGNPSMSTCQVVAVAGNAS
jgi:hypothetical protein